MSAPFSEVESNSLQPAVLDELETHVQSQLGGRVRYFQLAALPDGLVLHGHAATYHAKQLAQEAVMRASNRPIVANEIEVS